MYSAPVTNQSKGRTERCQVNNVRRLVFLEQLTRLFRISKLHDTGINKWVNTVGVCAYLRSPSEEPANIQVSLYLLPNLEFSGSELIMCSIALPTRPVPPVTRTTVAIAVVECKELSRGEATIIWGT